LLFKKNSHGHYEVLKSPTETASYFLDPDSFQLHEEVMKKGQLLVGSIFFLGAPIIVASADNDYHLPKGGTYFHVFVQPLSSH